MIKCLPIYVINLPSATERREQSIEQFNSIGLSCNIFEATDGHDLTLDVKSSIVDQKMSRRWCYDISPSEIGCYLSHLKLWHIIAKGDSTGAFVFEDDFIVSPGLSSVMIALSEINFRHPTIVKLYSDTDKTHSVKTESFIDGYQLTTPYIIPWGSVAFYINQSAARMFTNKFKKIYRPVDVDVRHYWQTGVDVKLILPTPVEIDKRSIETSTLEQYRRSTRRKHLATWSGRVRMVTRKLRFEMGNLLHTPGRVL